jgi:hypothetical protein
MKSKMILLLAAALTCTALLAGSCSVLAVHRTSGPGWGNGPPAHARAHGYRSKTVQGYELVYDSDSGLYAVVGVPDCYYCDGRFYRFCDSRWQVSIRVDSGWTVLADDSLPPGLRAKHKTPPGQMKKAKASWSVARRVRQ